METNKLIIGIVSVMISIIVLGSLLIPGIQLAQSNNKDVLDNTVTSGTATFKVDGDDDYLFETAPAYYNFKINGNAVNITPWQSVSSVIITDQCRVDQSGHWYALFDSSGVRSSNVNTTNQNIVCSYDASDKLFTYTVYTDLTNEEVANTYSYTVENIVYAIPNGDYGAIYTAGDNDITYIVNDLSQVVCGGAYTTGDLDTSYFCEGSTIYVGNSSYTGSVTVTEAGYQDYSDVKVCNGFSVTIIDGEDSETFTPYTVFVPLHVEGHTKAQDNYNMLYGVIPIFIVIAILIAAAVMFIKRE